MKDRIAYLESLMHKVVKNIDGKETSVEEKYGENFEKYARYEGNGVYQWKGIRATDTAVLYMTGVLLSEKIPFEQI